MWHQYSREVGTSNPGALDFLIGQRALVAGHSQKEIALMLVVNSTVVRKIEQEQGRERARKYVNTVARQICTRQQLRQVPRKRIKGQQMELGD
jgi:hypothetical protein